VTVKSAVTLSGVSCRKCLKNLWYRTDITKTHILNCRFQVSSSVESSRSL